MGIRQWKLPEQDPAAAEKLAADTGLPVLVCKILAARGITEAAAAARFVGEEDQLDDPMLLADMDKAVERITRAMEEDEQIAVYGDYDCDGITATALLTSYLQSVGTNVIYYVPSREKEGYGLNNTAIDLLHGQRVDLIITVDNGVSAHQEVLYAKGLGMDIVITDHHTPRDTLPEAVAVINPHRADCGSHYKDLAGVGVAFKLICALEQCHGDELLEYYSDLVTLGTIADVVPLTGENRAIVRHGLHRITETERPGISALLEVSGLNQRILTSESVAFGIIPRINASGRIGCVDEVIELLLTDDPNYAEEIAALVNQQNIQRKNIEETMIREIESMVAETPQILNQRVLVLGGKGWHHGVVGIAAAKMVERYGKPCILFSEEDGVARGSGRSVKGFDLIGAITACSARLTQFGGHKLAAGLTLPADELEAFNRELQAFARDNYDIMPLPELAADCTLSPAELTVESIARLSLLEPFGAANESPLFHLAGLVISGIYPTSDRKHIRIRFNWGGAQFYAVYFGVSDTVFPYKAGETVDIMAKISAGEYNGKPQLSVKLSDLRPAHIPQERMLLGREWYACYLREEAYPPQRAQAMLPGRDDIAVVYKFLRRCGSYPYGVDALYFQLHKEDIDYCKMLLAIDVLAEMGLIRREGGSPECVLTIVPHPPKTDLSQSIILQKLKAEMLVKEIERV